MTTLNDIRDRLSAPFNPAVVELKPGATNQDKSKGLALAYVDARHYQARLDEVAGDAGWSVSYRPWGDRAVICALTILGVTREDVGEAESNDPNQATSAAMQSFKRACAAFGLGRYLYTDLPATWAELEQRGKNHLIKNPQHVVGQMYHQAGIRLDRREALLARMSVLLSTLDDAELTELGKSIAAKQPQKKAA